MAFTRKFLKALGIEDDKIEQIIDAHTDVTDALKADRDKYKADAEKLPQVQKDLDDANKALKDADVDGYKAKYEKEKKDFEAYKKDIVAKETNEKKVAAYKALLKKAGVSEKHIDLITKAKDISEITLQDDGTIKDAEDMEKGIKEQYKIYIPDIKEEGAGTEHPPKGDGGRTVSRAAQIGAKYNEMVYGVKGDNK